MSLGCPHLQVVGRHVQPEQGDVVHLGHVVVVVGDHLLDTKCWTPVIRDVIGSSNNLQGPGLLTLDTMRGRHDPVLGNEGSSTEMHALAGDKSVPDPQLQRCLIGQRSDGSLLSIDNPSLLLLDQTRG